MPYLMCENCGGYYQIPKDAVVKNLDCHNCGGRLNFIEQFHESSGEEETINTNISVSKSFYKRIAVIGLFLGIMGMVLHYYALIQPLLSKNQFLEAAEIGFSLITPFFILSLILMVMGMSLFLYAHRKHTEIKRQIKYSHLESLGSLSSNYSIFNNVEIPGKKKIQQIIVGPTGIFIIHYILPKNQLIINQGRWYYQRGSKKIPTRVNAAKDILEIRAQIKVVLDSQYIPLEDDQIISIVSFENDNYVVEKEPVYYHIMDMDHIVDFITNQRIQVDDEVLGRIVDLFKHISD